MYSYKKDMLLRFSLLKKGYNMKKIRTTTDAGIIDAWLSSTDNFILETDEENVNIIKQLEKEYLTEIGGLVQVDDSMGFPELVISDNTITDIKWYAGKNSIDTLVCAEYSAILSNSNISFRIYYGTNVDFIVGDNATIQLLKEYGASLNVQFHNGVARLKPEKSDVSPKAKCFLNIKIQFWDNERSNKNGNC